MLKDNEVLRTSCTEEYYYNKPVLAQSVEELFRDVPLVPSNENYYSTVGMRGITGIKGTAGLVEWIEQYLLSVKDRFDCPEATNIKFGLTWATKLHKDSRVHCHHHSRDHHGVAIFYYRTPPKGSDLVIVDNGVVSEPISKQIPDNCEVFTAVTGDVIVHTSTAMHGVDVYTHTDETIAFVFDFNYVN